MQFFWPVLKHEYMKCMCLKKIGNQQELSCKSVSYTVKQYDGAYKQYWCYGRKMKQ